MTSDRLIRWSLSGILLLLAISATPERAIAQDEKAKVDPAAKKLAAAGGLFHQSMFKMAADTYAEFIERYPTHAEITTARYGLAISRYRLAGAQRVKNPEAAAKEYEAAAKELAIVAADAKFAQGDQALAVLGHCQLSLKAYDKALASFDALVKRYPKSPHAESVSLNRAQTLYMLGKFEPARDACAAFIKTYEKSSSRMTAQYFLALSLKSLKDYAKAAAAIEELLKTPNCPFEIDALLMLGQCQQNTGKLEQAVETYRKMIKVSPPNRQIDARYSLAVVLYEAEKYTDAVTECKAVLAVKGNRYEAAARFQLGLSQWAANDVPGARATFEQVVKEDASRKTQAGYWLARCDMAGDKFDLARKTLVAMQASKDVPNAEQVAYDIAVCSMSLKNFEQAAADFEAYRKAFPKGPKFVDTLYRQAFCLHQLKKYEACHAMCAKVIAAGDSPVKQASAELAAESLFLAGKYPEAEKELAALAKTAKDDVAKLRFAVRIGQCAFFAKDYKRAAELLAVPAMDKRVAADDALREAILILGDARLRTEQFAPAGEAFTLYLTVSKKNIEEARYKLAISYLRADKKAESAKAFESVIGGDVASKWVLRSLFEYGQMMYHGKQSEKASAALKKVLAAKAPEEDLTAGATYLMAWIDFDAKKYPEAAKQFAQMVSAHPKHNLTKGAAFQQALCMQLDKKLPEALTLFTAYAKAYPGDKRAAEANRMAAQCLTGQDKHAEAAKLLTVIAADAKAVSDEVLYELAWAQRLSDAIDPAIATYRKLITAYPKTGKLVSAQAELADLLYDKKEQYKEAAELLTAVLADKTADPKTLSVSHYRLGWCYQKTGDTANEAKTFSEFAAKYPKDPAAASAMYQAGAAYTKLSKWDLAAGQFSALLKAFPKHELAPQSYIQLGQVQGEAGKFDEARASYQAFLAANAKHKLAYLAKFGIGWSYESQKKYDDARKWYSAVEESHNGSTAARAKFQIGETYFAEKKYERAARELIAVDAVYDYPEWSARALVEAGKALGAAGQNDLAKKQYEACVKKYPKSKSAEVAAKTLKALGQE